MLGGLNTGATQPPGKMSLEELQNCFQVDKRYGEAGDWPHETILLFLFDTNIKEDDIKSNQWLRLVNTTGSSGEHAERQLISYLKKVQMSSDNYITNVKIIINYSPCTSCCEELKRFKRGLNSPPDISIQFANFYKSYETANLEGLVDLLADGFSLMVFEGQDGWTKRFTFSNTTDENPSRLITCITETRLERQQVDSKILKAIEVCLNIKNRLGEIPENANELLEAIGTSKTKTDAQEKLDQLIMEEITLRTKEM